MAKNNKSALGNLNQMSNLTKNTLGLEIEEVVEPKAKKTKKAKIKGRPKTDVRGFSVCIYLTEDLKEFVERRAEEEDRSTSQYISRLIKAEMNKGK